MRRVWPPSAVSAVLHFKTEVEVDSKLEYSIWLSPEKLEWSVSAQVALDQELTRVGGKVSQDTSGIGSSGYGE